MEPKTLIKKIEEETLAIILDQEDKKAMSDEKANQIATFVLDSLKKNFTIDQIYEVVKNFDDHFPELRKVVIDISEDYNNYIKKQVIQKVDELIKNKKIDDADNVLSQAITDESKVSESILEPEYLDTITKT